MTTKTRLLKESIKEAIKIGRKYMAFPNSQLSIPSKEEWALALVLFQEKLRNEN